MGNLGVTVGIIAKQSGGALGKIMLRDENVSRFNSIDGARDYIKEFTDAEITEESFDTVLNAYFFTVPAGSDFAKRTGFCSVNSGGDTFQFIDDCGLATHFLDEAFLENKCDNYLKNAFFEGSSVFNGSTGNNVLINIRVIGDDFFRGSTGKNTIITGNITSNYAFANYSDSTNHFEKCQFKGDYSFYSNSCKNEFDTCEFANFNFTNSSGTNVFYGNTIFQASCFFSSSSDNIFYGDVEATTSFFYQALAGNNIFYKSLTVGNSAFTNAFSDNFITKITAGNNLFRTASPKGKNTIVHLVSCDINSFKDYTGCIYFHKLGNDYSQTLPADIFTVTTECSVNFDFKLKANNDADYLQMVTNITANPAQKQMTLF